MSTDALPNRRSVRLRAYDYTSYGAYFVTIVTADRACLLSDITGDSLTLSPLGRIVQEEWQHTAELRENIELDEFVIMPNHMHGIIWITDNRPETTTGVPQHAPTTRILAPPRFGSLSATINGFKGSVTRRARTEIGIQQVWQRGFYEHIVRSDKALDAIRLYISDNPRKWAEDAENPANRL